MLRCHHNGKFSWADADFIGDKCRLLLFEELLYASNKKKKIHIESVGEKQSDMDGHYSAINSPLDATLGAKIPRPKVLWYVNSAIPTPMLFRYTIDVAQVWYIDVMSHWY